MLNYKARNSDSVLLKSYLWFLKFYSWARNLPIMGSIFRFGYALLLLGKTNWKEAKEYKKEYSKLGHKISWYDVVSSYFKHGSIAKEYFIYRFFEKEPEERAFWVTEGIRFCFDKPLHIPLMPLIWDKYNFYSKYHKYMGREIILLDNNSNLNEVDEWCRTRGKFVVKPRMGFGGGGISFFEYNSQPGAITGRLEELSRKGSFVIEEIIEQHPDIAKFNPSSVNSIRINSMEKNGKLSFWGAFLRMGMGLEVDNMALGAIAAPIDISSGVIVGEAFRSVGSGQNKTYSQHPQTKVQITGFEIPYWDEVIRLVYDLCEHVPGDKYVGWDVAIGPAGPIVIEGNFGWSMIPFQVFNDRGMLEELLPYFDNRCLYPVQKKYV